MVVLNRVNTSWCVDQGRKLVLEGDGLVQLIEVLERSTSQPDTDSTRQLRSCAAGFLLNLIMGQEELYFQVSYSSFVAFNFV